LRRGTEEDTRIRNLENLNASRTANIAENSNGAKVTKVSCRLSATSE